MSRRRGAADSKTVRVSEKGLIFQDRGIWTKQTKHFQQEAQKYQTWGAVAELSSHLESADTRSCYDNRRYLVVPGAYT